MFDDIVFLKYSLIEAFRQLMQILFFFSPWEELILRREQELQVASKQNLQIFLLDFLESRDSLKLKQQILQIRWSLWAVMSVDTFVEAPTKLRTKFTLAERPKES